MTDYNSDNRYHDYTSEPRVRYADDLYEFDETYTRPAERASERPSGASSSGQRQMRSGSRPVRSGSGSSYSGQRQTRSAARPSSQGRRPMSSNRKLFRRRKKKFKKMLLIYIAVLVVILIIGSVAFSLYLSSYENSQPSHTAESIVKSYSSQQGIIDFINNNAAKSDLMGDIQEVSALYATNIAGKTISYKENKDFRPDSPSYDIIADGSVAAKVTLGAQGSGWEVSALSIAQYLPDTMSATIEAPAGSSVTVNGTLLDSGYITASATPEILSSSLQFIQDPPKYDTYVISGLVSEPSVSVTSSTGQPLEVTKTDDKYVLSTPADQSFISSVEDRVYDALDNYATYFIHMSFSLANYIVYGSELYSNIFGSDEYDPIDTNLYNWEQIDTYEFAERSVSNFIQYSDDCFTVDIKYALDMYFTDPTFSDNNQKMDATWVFVIEPLDGSWCISDIIAH